MLEFVAASQEVILVTTPEPTSITDSYALLKALSMYNGFDYESTNVMIVANRVNSVNESSNLYEKLSAVVNRFLKIKISYLGAIPYDQYINKAVMKQKPVSIAYPSASASKSFQAISTRLAKNETVQVGRAKGVARFFSRVFSSNKRV